MKTNCLKNRKNLKKILFSFLVTPVFLLILNVGTASAAYNSISLSPASGTIYTSGTNLSVNVDSGNDNFIGVNIVITYTGSVEFVEGSVVDKSICDNLNHFTSVNSEGNKVLSVSCISFSSRKYSGPAITLKFKATENSGSSTFRLSANDGTVADGVTTLSGGTYSLALGAMGGGLPQSGIFDNVSHKVIIGSSLILLGVLFAVMPAIFPRLSFFVKDTHKVLNVSFSNTIRGFLAKQKENSEKRRRGKLEKKF